jgi:uncharacterized protein YggE
MNFPLRTVRRAIPVFLLICIEFQIARAADDSDRVTVMATGRSSVAPDVAEVRATVTGNAPLAEDALKRFRENHRRALQALNALKLADLTIHEGGLSIQSTNPNAQNIMQMMGQGNANQPTTVTVAEILTIRLAGIDRQKEQDVIAKVVKIVDATKDAGMTMGSGKPTSMVAIQLGSDGKAKLAMFRSTKAEEARAAATRDAMKAARQKAETLAALSNLTLGRVVSAREASLATPANNAAAGISMWTSMMGVDSEEHADGESAGSPDLKPIVVTVSLEAQFALTPGK